jgi:hypothetical protein
MKTSKYYHLSLLLLLINFMVIQKVHIYFGDPDAVGPGAPILNNRNLGTWFIPAICWPDVEVPGSRICRVNDITQSGYSYQGDTTSPECTASSTNSCSDDGNFNDPIAYTLLCPFIPATCGNDIILDVREGRTHVRIYDGGGTTYYWGDCWYKLQGAGEYTINANLYPTYGAIYSGAVGNEMKLKKTMNYCREYKVRPDEDHESVWVIVR